MAKDNSYYKSWIAWLSVVAGLLLAGLIAVFVALINTTIELEKNQAILDVACSWSGDKATCKAGLKLLENMDIEDIEDMGR